MVVMPVGNGPAGLGLILIPGPAFINHGIHEVGHHPEYEHTANDIEAVHLVAGNDLFGNSRLLGLDPERLKYHKNE